MRKCHPVLTSSGSMHIYPSKSLYTIGGVEVGLMVARDSWCLHKFIHCKGENALNNIVS